MKEVSAMDKKEIFINNVIIGMQDKLNSEQLRELDNIIRINLRGIQIEEECTEL